MFGLFESKSRKERRLAGASTAARANIYRKLDIMKHDGFSLTEYQEQRQQYNSNIQ